MESKILVFLEKHRIGSLTVLLKNSSPHAAAVHFSHKSEPLQLFISTTKESKKCEALLDGSLVKASVVIGFSEEEWKTLQLDGEIKAIFDREELRQAKEIHYKKHPKAEQYENDPETIFLVFTPKWWRFSDYNTAPPTISSSDR